MLRKGDVEIPSDLYGVVYTTMDSGNGWKIELARELKDAGFEFDADKVLVSLCRQIEAGRLGF